MRARRRRKLTVLTPFHVALQVRNIAEARRFYGDVLGCDEGRSDTDWVDFNLYGHQFVCHFNPNLGEDGRITSHYNPVEARRSGTTLRCRIGNAGLERFGRETTYSTRRVRHRALYPLPRTTR